MEALYAEFLLWFHGFNPGDKYEALLNECFLNNPNNSILLELEERSNSMLDTHGRFTRYWTYEQPTLNPEILGKRLFSGLKCVYDSNTFSIEEFSRRCFLLWDNLPSAIDQTEPFWTLDYAGDCLSWGDETQTRNLFEKAFSFYDLHSLP